MVPVEWRSGPIEPGLLRLRETLKPVRDNILAHSIGDPRVLGKFIADEVRELLKLNLALATNMHLVFSGSAVPADDWIEFCQEHAGKFWPIAFQGFVDQHRKQMTALERLKSDIVQSG